MELNTISQSVLEKMTEGYASHKIITDNSGTPIDYEFIDVNIAFENLTGLKRAEIIGKKATEILPGIESDPANWIKRYGNVALHGDAFEFEEFFKPLKNWFSGLVYSPETGYFVIVFDTSNITRKLEAQANFPVNAIKNSPNLLFKLQIETGWPVEYISENVSQFGYTAEEIC